MAIEKIQELLKAIQADPAARELLEKAAKPTNQEEEIKLYASVAREIGIDLTEEELKDHFQKMEARRKEITAARMKQVEEIADDELAGVAGGEYSPMVLTCPNHMYGPKIDPFPDFSQPDSSCAEGKQLL